LRVVGEPIPIPQRPKNEELRPREFLTAQGVDRLIATAEKRGRYGQRDATAILGESRLPAGQRRRTALSNGARQSVKLSSGNGGCLGFPELHAFLTGVGAGQSRCAIHNRSDRWRNQSATSALRPTTIEQLK
jgi:hypothetical protein